MFFEYLLMVAFLVDSQVLPTQAEASYCSKQDKQGYCLDPVVTYTVKEGEISPRIRLNCSLGSVLTIPIPEGETLRGDPAVGNGAILNISVQRDPAQILVWPRIPKGSSAVPGDLFGQTSNLVITLSSGISVLIELQVTALETSVQRLVLSVPGSAKRATAKDQLREEVRKELEAEYKVRRAGLDEEAAKKAIERMGRSVLSRVHCNEPRSRATRDLLVVRAEQICQIGDMVYVKFSVHNRARDLFALSSVEVLSVNGDKMASVEATVFWEAGDKPQLRFDAKAKAVAAFVVTENTAAAEYAIRVTESAGKKRVVLVQHVSF